MKIMIAITALCVGLLLGAFTMGLKTVETPAPEYGIYEYNYNESIVFRYRDNLAVYEWSTSGLHIVSITKGEENLGSFRVKSQDEALEFCRIYLEDLRREDQLK
jgi:hypothetical protein